MNNQDFTCIHLNTSKNAQRSIDKWEQRNRKTKKYEIHHFDEF